MNRRQADTPNALSVPDHREGQTHSDVKRLVAQYGGRASNWLKKSSPQIEVSGKYIEYHWYEHPGIGRFEINEVRINHE
jgi:hypothetical protein